MPVIKYANWHYISLMWFIPVVIGVFIYYIFYSRSKITAFGNSRLIYGGNARPGPFFRLLKFATAILAFSLLLVALLNPQMGTKIEKVKREGIDIIFALDISRSMMAEDIKPNRLEKAKLEISRFIDKLKYDRVGIIGFSSDSFLQLPLTTDYVAAKMLLRKMGPNQISNQGTSIESALSMAVRSFEETAEGPAATGSKVLILLSDGESHSEEYDDLIKKAKEENITIYTIGIGTLRGVPIPQYNRYGQRVSYKKDRSGNQIVTKLNPENLQYLAAQAGGQYFHGRSGSHLEEIFAELNKMEKGNFEEKRISGYESIYYYFLIPALILFVLEMILPDNRKRFRFLQNIFSPLNKKEVAA